MSEPADAVEFQAVPAQRVATITRRAVGFGSSAIGPVVGPIFPEALALLVAAGVPVGLAVADYRPDEGGDGPGVFVTAGFEVGADVDAVPGLEVHVLPAVQKAATVVHHGSMETIDRSWQALMDAARDRGESPSAGGREIYLTPGDRPQSEWVTRLVQPVVRAS